MPNYCIDCDEELYGDEADELGFLCDDCFEPDADE